MTLRETYDLIARSWHAVHAQDDWWMKGTDYFVSLLKPGSKVLDIGCGGGTKSRYLVDRGMQVCGIDFSDEMITIAREQVPEAEFLVADATKLASLKRSFDACFAQASLLHIPRRDAATVVRQWVSLVDPGGYCYIAVKAKRPDGPAEEEKHEDDLGFAYTRFFSYFTDEEIMSYLKDAGCHICYATVTQSGGTRWIQIIAQRK